MKTIPILFTFDPSLIIPAGVCISSLLESAEKDTFYDIFILYGESFSFDESYLDRLSNKYENFHITYRKVKGEFKGAYEVRGIPETAYYRLISPELIPEYDKILYSDVDVIFREDQARYYDIELGDNYFAAVDNCSALRPNVQKYLYDELGLNFREGYFYSGNLLINSSLILREGVVDKFRSLATNKYKQQDMDIINIVCNGRIKALNPSFCLTVQLYNLIMERRMDMSRIYGDEALRYALTHGTVHYNGAKPWQKPCMNMDIWWKYYRESVFFDEKMCHDFWKKQSSALERLSFVKRVKILLRYPLDRKMINKQ